MNKKLLCLLMVFCLVLSLTACGSNNQAAPSTEKGTNPVKIEATPTPEPQLTAADFEGTWKASADVSDEISDSFSTDDLTEAFGGADVSGYIDVKDLKIPPVTLLMELNSDKTFTMVLDDSSKPIIAGAVSDWFASCDFEGLFTAILESQCEQYGVTMEEMMTSLGAEDVSGMLEIMLGMPVSEYMAELGDEIASGMDTDLDLSQFGDSGTWEYKDGKVILTTDDGIDELSYDKEADTLTEPNDLSMGDLVFHRG